MNKEQLLNYIDHGRDIEFRFDRKMYSITYGTIENEHVISFCEFYKESTEVKHRRDLRCCKEWCKRLADVRISKRG